MFWILLIDFSFDFLIKFPEVFAVLSQIPSCDNTTLFKFAYMAKLFTLIAACSSLPAGKMPCQESDLQANIYQGVVLFRFGLLTGLQSARRGQATSEPEGAAISGPPSIKESRS